VKTRDLFATGVAASFLFVAQATAQQPDARQSAYIAANCANCHGTTGASGSAMPSLSGLKKEYVVEQMRAFRDGKRPATIMHQIAKGYTDDQTNGVAEYFARQAAK